ncbi:DUF1236 domain-containing protein [Sinorhizobium medicae]|uniref:DUF1236 domain-containing protein n=3 Tax=Sinorhizobium medicae TaxID=110321 RepID=A0A6G1WDY6_9HYPH|nr:DUF1236 domain-containing protein [Sinorhizobium medicae]ABR61074.1 protein of unknown function DUF1236 [Sinorhizobium medicae WSM419]MBO1943552.1 DUF1236 domain-containing protein [Sinorhizobium medicae]MBO1959224.1 DUF1236 domain-containing protein [Sinorhizobium medicae]MDX0405562.1 DUF1236 domain-containing protein [Sinorhizobium medicae]MDX0411082.1 DUF1236 domain-containing protein [Sinorhizobium medicae]
MMKTLSPTPSKAARLRAALTASALLAVIPSAYAEMSATTLTDLNVRAGPGPQYPAVGVATRGSAAVLDGCMEGSNWCRIDVNGLRGWAYARYLATDMGGTTAVIQERRTELSVPTVTYEGEMVAATSEPLELVGPVEEVEAVTPPPTVRTYITENPVDTVYVDGEAVVGATLPNTVSVQPIPDYEYQYVTINGQPVLVDPGTRRVVYVYR